MLCDLKPNTPEWGEMRRTCVGASDFAVIAATHGYSKNIFNKSINTLIIDKVENRKYDNPIFKLGHEIENNILNSIEDDGACLVRGGVFKYDDNERILASLDAYDIFKADIVEIKSTQKDKSQYEEMLNYYKLQLLSQLYTTGYNSGSIVIYNKVLECTDTYNYTLHDLSSIISKDKWLEMCNDFLVKLDMAYNPDFLLQLKFNDYFNKKDHIDTLTAELGELRNELITLSPDGIVCGEYRVSKSTSNKINYDELVKDLKLNIDDKYKIQLVSYKINYDELVKDLKLNIDDKYKIQSSSYKLLRGKQNG